MPDSDWWAKVAEERDGRVRLAIRVFVGGVKQSEERLDAKPEQLDELLPQLAEKHANMMAIQPGMVEIEFLDEPDVNTRFFRMGTDRSGMVDPMAVDLSRPAEQFLSKWRGAKGGRRQH